MIAVCGVHLFSICLSPIHIQAYLHLKQLSCIDNLVSTWVKKIIPAPQQHYATCDMGHDMLTERKSWRLRPILTTTQLYILYLFIK